MWLPVLQTALWGEFLLRNSAACAQKTLTAQEVPRTHLEQAKPSFIWEKVLSGVKRKTFPLGKLPSGSGNAQRPPMHQEPPLPWQNLRKWEEIPGKTPHIPPPQAPHPCSQGAELGCHSWHVEHSNTVNQCFIFSMERYMTSRELQGNELVWQTSPGALGSVGLRQDIWREKPPTLQLYQQHSPSEPQGSATVFPLFKDPRVAIPEEDLAPGAGRKGHKSGVELRRISVAALGSTEAAQSVPGVYCTVLRQV